MTLDISSLDRAVAKLEQFHAMGSSDDARASESVSEAFRMAAIQAFEFTYEQSLKTVKRFLEMNELSPKNYDGETFQAIIRAAYVHGLLLNDLSAWVEYRKKRGTTSHAYNEEKAQKVYDAIPEFIREARYLRDRIKERIADS